MIAPVTSGWSISPGGICTHWKTPPYHGAHPKRTLPQAQCSGLFFPLNVGVGRSRYAEEINLAD
jgi:hypothetical protein